jgi:hypothetical protein
VAQWIPGSMLRIAPEMTARKIRQQFQRDLHRPALLRKTFRFRRRANQ